MSTAERIALPPGYEPAPALLDGRVVLVTGATGGIGSAAARACAGHGAEVVLLGRTVRLLESLYDRIVEAGGREPAIYPMDLEGAGGQDYLDLAERLGEAFGRLDALVHCAVARPVPTPLEHHEPADWLRAFHVNVHAPFLLGQSLHGLLAAAPDPAVVFLVSALGHAARAYWGAHAASQFALRGLAEVMADELDGRVRVNCLDPGPVRTPLRAAAYPAEDPGALAEPDSIAGGLLYLLGPDAAGITGRWLCTDPAVTAAPAGN